MRRAAALAAVLTLAGCGGGPRVAQADGFQPRRGDHVAVAVDPLRDVGGVRHPQVEAQLAAVATQALMHAGVRVDALAANQLDVRPEGRANDASPLSDADALRLAEANCVAAVMVVTVTRSGLGDPRQPWALAARCVDAKSRVVTWSASYAESEPLWPPDPREALDDAARRLLEAFPKAR